MIASPSPASSRPHRDSKSTSTPPSRGRVTQPQTARASFDGMGAVVTPRGVGFRVWAPHADRVSVVGSFNNWNAQAHPMSREEHDTWQIFVPEARAGDEYQYVLGCGDREFRRTDPRARRVVNSVGNGIIWAHADIASAEARFVPPSLDQLVIYEMHVGTFNAIATKDGTSQTPGTFASAIEKLPHLHTLGINAIELMPIAEFAGDFSWGYNPAHPFAVESIYGGPDGLRDFVRAAHEQGIAVILDVVYNHFGPTDLAMWQFDGWSENQLGGIYFYNDWRASTPWGDTRPDYGRGEVRTYIHDNALMWLRDFGLDGLRWDMTVFIRSYRGSPGNADDDLKEGWGLMQWLNDSIHREFPHAITIAEDLRDSEWLVKGTGAGGAGFNAQWAAAFVHPVRATLITSDDQHRNLDALIGALQNRYDNDAFKRVVYSESHDEVANGKARLPSEIDGGAPDSHAARKRSMQGAGLVFTAPGVPMIFQGQELLEDEWFRDTVPINWAQREDHADILSFYRDLIAVRRNTQGATTGLSGQHIAVHHVEHERKILGFRRWREGGPGDEVIVLFNLSHQPVHDIALGVPAAGPWHVRLNSDSRVYGKDFSQLPDVASFAAVAEPCDGLPHRIVAALGAYSFLILSQDRGAPREP